MLKSHLGKLSVICLSAGMFASCTLEPLPDNLRVEAYTRNFIKTFGLIDPNQDWNMARQAVIPLNLGGQERESVKVYGKQGDTYYLIADLHNVKGKLQVPVDIPKTCEDIMVKVNGTKFYGRVGRTINCMDLSRGVPNGSNYPEDTNNSAVIYEATKGGYGVKVQYTTSGNDPVNPQYQIFNTQQMSPIVSPDPWVEYYSMNTNGWSGPNTLDQVGLLPESGKYNRKAYDIQSWLNAKKAENHELVIDFTVNPGDNGMITFFPYYYGTNLEHEIGVYLLDDRGEPRTDSDGNWIMFPIFRDREPGDLQVQPHYDNKITGIRIADNGYGQNTFRVNVDEEFYLDPYVEVEYNGSWIPYATYLSTYGPNTHSRVACHLWVPEANSPSDPEPVTYATCSKDGYVTGVTSTGNGDAYGCLAIATGLEAVNGKGITTGVKLDFSYKVIAPRTSTISRISVDEIETDDDYDHKVLKLKVGETKTLTVHCYDSNDQELTFNDYFDDLSVTENWHNTYFRIYKDNSARRIKIIGNGVGDQWAHIYDDLDSSNDPSGSDIDCSIHVVVEADGDVHRTETHTKTEDVNTWPTGASATWDSFFEEKPVGDTDETVTVEILHNMVPQEIRDKFVSGPNDWSLVWSNTYTYTDDDNVQHTEYFYEELYKYFQDGTGARFRAWTTQYPVQGLTVTGANNYQPVRAVNPRQNDAVITDLRNYNNGEVNQYNLAFSIVFADQNSGSGAPQTYMAWTANGKAQAQAALEAYYSGRTANFECELGEREFEFSSVQLNNNAVYSDNGAHTIYTVTWTHTESFTQGSKPGRRAAARRQTSRPLAPALSRDGSKPALLTDNGNWVDVSSYWSRYLPNQEEVSCYPPNMTMLGRSRGHDITLTNPDGTPYTGDFGMYMKVLGSNDADADNNRTYTPYSEPWTVYSERKYNTATNGTNYPQISAVSFKHPVTDRPFLSFEDMRVTHAGDDEIGGSAYGYWEKSSDRDINDLVFYVSGFESISDKDGNTIKNEKVQDAGFPWLWAVEDLGSTDDFDFNDAVVKISSITTTNKSTETPTDGDPVVKWSVLRKEVSFTPMAAGGTLPIHIHLVINGTDYVLRPGTYNLTGDSGFTVSGVTFDDLSLLTSGESDAAEVHKWFGTNGYSSSTMINTGYGVVSTAKTCRLYVPAPTCDESTGALNNDGFAINIFSTGTNTVDNKAAQSATVHFYLSVVGNASQAEINDERLNISNRTLGAPAQSFVVKGTEWKWPKERSHILDAYPDFGNWVSSPSNTTWMENINSDEIYH